MKSTRVVLNLRAMAKLVSFSANGAIDGTDDAYEAAEAPFLSLQRETWKALGEPKQLTVTIKPSGPIPKGKS